MQLVDKLVGNLQYRTFVSRSNSRESFLPVTLTRIYASTDDMIYVEVFEASCSSYCGVSFCVCVLGCTRTASTP